MHVVRCPTEVHYTAVPELPHKYGWATSGNGHEHSRRMRCERDGSTGIVTIGKEGKCGWHTRQNGMVSLSRYHLIGDVAGITVPSVASEPQLENQVRHTGLLAYRTFVSVPL